MNNSTKFNPFSYSYTSTTSSNANTFESTINKGLDSDQSIVSDLDSIRQRKKELLIEEGRAIEKGLGSDDPDIVIKANSAWEDVKNRVDSGIKTTIIDPYEFKDSLGFKSKPTAMSYGILRRMANTPFVKSVITTRQSQVSEFAKPQANKFEAGFIIKKRQKYFSEKQEDVTDADREQMDMIANFLLNGGNENNSWNGDTFETFLKKIVEDSLTLDQVTAEIVRNNFGTPVEFLATDAATFRIADTFSQDDNTNGLEKPKKRGYLPKYVQIIDGAIINDYYPWELMFGVRNSTTNIHNNGYGRSELETLVQIVTWMLYSDTYNGNFFSQGSSPKGFLKVAGNVNSNRIQEFRQQWMSMTAGVMNAWKIPIIESEKMEWVDLQKNNTDMQFAQWQEYLLKVVCAVYKISPEELGFSVKGAGGLGDGGNANDSKVKYSRDKGLKPLLRNIEFWINKWIVSALDNDFEFNFVGLDIETEEKTLEMDIKRASTFMGLKEVRRKNDMPEELEEGDMILNPVWQQAQAMAQMQGAQDESTEVAEDQGGGVWDELDEDDDTEKSVDWNPFLEDLNDFTKSLMHED